MHGYDMRVVRNGELLTFKTHSRVVGGQTVYSYLPKCMDALPVDPGKLVNESAFEIHCNNRHLILLTMHAGDFPVALNIPSDEIIFVESWYQH